MDTICIPKNTSKTRAKSYAGTKNSFPTLLFYRVCKNIFPGGDTMNFILNESL